MRTALLFQERNFVGREYYAALFEAGLAPDIVVSVGSMKAESIVVERERTGGQWNPPVIADTVEVIRFDRLADQGLVDLLKDIDVAIQGGVGILKGDILAAPSVGWVNIHPGKLPSYRGNACPEWAILNGDPVVASAHFIDGGIDTGPLLYELNYDISQSWTYFDFRTNLYRHCARVLIEALGCLKIAGKNAKLIATPQSTENACYWPPLGAKERSAVRALFPLAARSN
jgi:methionyl-tRNA formyltransferase